MSKNSASVPLRFKEGTFRGEESNSYVGSVKIKGKEYLISVRAEGQIPSIQEGEWKGQSQLTVWANVHPLPTGTNGQRKRKNEIS